jgi:formate dehydrogenase subunit gamma
MDLKRLIASFGRRRDQLLPILHAVQNREKYVSEAAIKEIADHLNLTRADVHGVVSFYHDFRSRKPETPRLQVCVSEACKARGADAIFEMAKAIAGGEVQIEPVYCLGLCSIGPAAKTENGEIRARLDRDKVEQVIEMLS